LKDERGATMRLSKYVHVFPFEGYYWAFNELNANLINFGYSDYRKIMNNEFDKLSPNLLDLMKTSLFLVSDTFDEDAEYDKNIQKSKFSNVLGLTIGVTMSCNFNCFYCFEQEYRGTGKMSKETADQIVKFCLSRATPEKMLSITWYGGEPLLASDIIEYLTNKFREANFNIVGSDIITNGYLLNKRNAELLVRAGVTSLQITIDGPKQTHDKRRILRNGAGTYDVIVNNIKENAHLFNNIQLRINADKEIIEYVPELLEEIRTTFPPNVTPYLAFVRTESVKNPTFGEVCFSDKEYAEAYLDYLYLGTQLPQPYYGCSATMENGWGIDDEGYLYKCWEDVGNKKHAVGDVWNGITNYDLYKKWLSYSTSSFPNKCKDCSVKVVCGGGKCPFRALFPDETTVGVLCSPEKWYMEDIVKYWIVHNVIPQWQANSNVSQNAATQATESVAQENQKAIPISIDLPNLPEKENIPSAQGNFKNDQGSSGFPDQKNKGNSLFKNIFSRFSNKKEDEKA